MRRPLPTLAFLILFSAVAPRMVARDHGLLPGSVGLVYDCNATRGFAEDDEKVIGPAIGIPATTAPGSDSAMANEGGRPAVTPPANLTTEQSAAVPAAPGANQTSTATGDSQWHFSVTPYLWFPGAHGDIGAFDRNVGFRASAIDLLSHFRFGVEGTFEASRKRLLITLDLIDLRLAADKQPFPQLDEISADIRTHAVLLTPKIGLRVIDKEKIKIDGLAGIRYWHFGENLNFNPSVLGLNFSGSQNWVSPLVGGRIEAPLSPKLTLTVAGDVGGWGVGSQLEYELGGALGYKINPKMALQAGYRYLFLDYMAGGDVGAVVKTALSGLIFGFTFQLGSPR
jgi:hypothetical protein